MAKRQIAHPKRGEIWLVSFDPTIGAEVRKTRPALIIQNDIGNEFSPIIIVAAISSKFGTEIYPIETRIEPPEGGLIIPSVVQLNQIRSIDKRRLLKRLGNLGPDTMERAQRAILISLGMLNMSQDI